jgi:hypothetical protein
MSRAAVHSAVSATLARYSDDELLGLIDANPSGSGIGGTTALLQIDGTKVFVKRLPVTDLELQNPKSTANLFELPSFCHYGVGLIGAPGFGAWRELAVHEMTTNWVLNGDHEGFPLMYHWRALPHPGQVLPEELSDVDKAVACWGGGEEIRHRIEAVRDATASIALSLEHFPHNLHDWLDPADEDARTMVETQLEAGTSFMNAHGLLHFDGHFQNILTDGEQLFFGDFGLAISSEFDLSEDEKEFFAAHQDYDRLYTTTYLLRWLRHALGEVPPRIIERHGRTAEIMGEFIRRFQENPQLSARFWNASSTSTHPPELSS